MAFDLEQIKRDNRLADFIGQRIKLKRVGHEFIGLCPFHKERSPSFTITDQKGFAHCFGCAWHGDIIRFVQDYHGVDFKYACEVLGGANQAPDHKPTPVEKLPPDPTFEPTEIPDSFEGFHPGDRIRAWNPRSGDNGATVTYRPDNIWAYEDQAGNLLGYICRTNLDDGKRFFTPIRYALVDGLPGWVVSAFPTPRPLYGLPQLNRDGPVYLCEGEKSADACRELTGEISLSWPGGVNGVSNTDFSPLRGRDIIVWGDADQVGEDAALNVARAVEFEGARSVRVIPWDHDRPAGWDAADALDEGMVWSASPIEPVEPVFTPGEFDANPFDGHLPGPRPWAFARFLLYGTASALAAPPGVGKSTWSLQLAVAFGQHKSLGPFDPVRTGPVWVWNNEDDPDELNRRVIAACQHADIPLSALAGKLYLNSGADLPLIVAREHAGKVMATPHVDRVIQVINEKRIRLLIVDPFAETFEVESENSNDAMKVVAAQYRRIAQQTGCAVLLIVHTPKSADFDKAAGTMDSIRGASAIAGVMRSVLTMFPMSELQAEKFGVDDEARHLYVRLDNAKGNMALKTNDIVWWRKETIILDNAADGYPDDHVGVLDFHDIKPPAAKRQEQVGEAMARVAEEIISVCDANGWVSSERYGTFENVIKAIDPAKAGIKSTAIRQIVTRNFAPSFAYQGRVIVISEEFRGPHVRRKIHAE